MNAAASHSSSLWDISGFWPKAHFAGAEISTYFIITSFAFVISLFYLVHRAEARGLSPKRAVDLALVIMICGFLGSRAFHIFYEEQNYYAEDPMRALMFWRGGFVWYGGFIASSIGALVALRLRREPITPWLDVFAPVAALGYGLGRFACLASGCCFGEVCELANGAAFRHPTQLYASAWELALFALLIMIERRDRRMPERAEVRYQPGQLFFIWLLGHALGRILMETFRADPRGDTIVGLSIATVISIGAALLAIVTVVKSYRQEMRRELVREKK